MAPGKHTAKTGITYFLTSKNKNVMKKAKLFWLSASAIIMATACQKNTSPSELQRMPTDAASLAGKNGGITDVEKILAKYKLVWSDEFNGTQMDTSKWSYRANGTVRQYATVDGARYIRISPQQPRKSVANHSYQRLWQRPPITGIPGTLPRCRYRLSYLRTVMDRLRL